MSSLSNSVTKTQHCSGCCSEQSLSTGSKREGFSVYIFDSSCNVGSRYGKGRGNDGTTGTESTKVRDYLLEKLVEEESRASYKAPFEDIPECEG